MELSTKEFRDRIEKLSKTHFPDTEIQIREYSKFRIKLRLVLSVDLFVEIFYASQTGKASFALIEENERIFGIDNLGGWHRHPLGKSTNHVDIAKPELYEIFESLKSAKEDT